MESIIQNIFSLPNKKIDPGMINSRQVQHLITGLSSVVTDGIEGDVVELGCNVGESSKYLRLGLNFLNSNKQLWVYDSFEGLPSLSKFEEGTPWKPGTLKTTEDVLVGNFKSNHIKPPDHIIKGWFKDIQNHELPSKISFAFLDGDFYDSIYDSLVKIYDRVAEGGYIYFHDFDRHDLPGVKAAIDQFFIDRGQSHFAHSVCPELGLLIKRTQASQKKKLGFLHIPRTGGTHLERVLNPMGPDKFVNFFGANENQRQNHIPIIEDLKPNTKKSQLIIDNPNFKNCQLFAGHFSHNIKDCFNEDIDFFTILRDPVQRVTSLSKQFLTSSVYKNIICKNSEKIGDEIFYDNLFEYLSTNNTEGLLTHEVHGFSNYMTKVLAGCDISNPNITVDQNIFRIAVQNLKNMKYFGFFEDYDETIKDIQSILGVDFPYHCGPLKKSTVPENLHQLISKLNVFDLRLYNIAKSIKEKKSTNATYVTALLNINRENLNSELFHRPFNSYLKHLESLITALGNQKIIVYIEPEHIDFFNKFKSNNIIFKSITKDDILNSEYYSKIQKIRLDQNWSKQNSWLGDSPQSKLELYNPLIFQKIHLLNDVAQHNPFNTSHFFWIDAGIFNAQASPDTLSNNLLHPKLINDVDKFLFINYPYRNFKEIHGFLKSGLSKFYGGEINTVTRATFFGGRASYVNFFSNEFRKLAHKSLDLGYLGTEESLFTLLNYLHSDKINSRSINHNGLVGSYFNNLLNNNALSQVENVTFDFKPKPYNGLRNQQHPLAFTTFSKFFQKTPTLDLVIEIGSGFGGFSSFLYDQSKLHNFNFITYEKNTDKYKTIIHRNPNIDCRNHNALDPIAIDEINQLVSSHKETLILCDGDDIALEFNKLSNLLKPGDTIMAHDYAPNQEVFNSEYKNKIWNWMEVCDKDIENSVKDNDLIDSNPEFLKVAWCSKTSNSKIEKVNIVHSKRNTNLYFLTFNFPDQLSYTIDTLKETPEWIDKPNIFVIDNSDKLNAQSENQKICKTMGFTYINSGGNIGICGGRQAAAEHFHDSSADFMLFFEDDMTLNSSEYEGKFCRNGFRKYVPNLYDSIHNIMLQDNFDFLKLSFTEVYFDNDKQCSWYNVPQNVRTKFWPDYDQLPERGLDPNVPLTNFKNIRHFNNCSYIDGEIYYANWPTIVSKSGNQKMFIDTKWAHPYEQTWMSYMFQQTKKGQLRPSVLLASPITHNRFKHYQPEERREN